MVGQTPAMSYESLRTRVEELELDRDRRAVSDAHSRFYAALAVAALVLTFTPVLESGRFRSLWDIVTSGGIPTVLSLVPGALLIGCLTVAAARVVSVALPIGIAALAAGALWALAYKPGAGEPEPELTPVGLAAALLAVATIVIGVSHAVHMLRRS